MSSESVRNPQRNLLPKQPLSKPPRQVPFLLNPSSTGAEIQFQLPSHLKPAGTAKLQAKRVPERELRVIEFDASRIPQPFLDGEKVLQSMISLRTGKKEDHGHQSMVTR
ncbi:predicted protein [Uncinocarpus reesii 1704]|uniref:Uncharacterized protein n=1 Tax=Uncinocarpus reesii (strain UAMH 1704) TaxID=336963 RepID=C4JJC1_UNCRE|nr:uncharacterized protein UREG_01728 [Uncinocarpus reesii 1704]EEP76879.1 predicted protein [Uncinocarpus reesii 1704]